MPGQWVDKDTGHRIIKLTKRVGPNRVFYFHNNPFVGNEMVFHGLPKKKEGEELSANGGPATRQMFAVDLKTLAVRQLTKERYAVDTEIVCEKSHELFFQHGDTIYALNIDNLTKRVVAIVPEDLRGVLFTVNSEGTLLAGVLDNKDQQEFIKNNSNGGSLFGSLQEAHFKNTIFTVDVLTGKIDTVYSEKNWLSHLQFSPTKPSQLMFCHEGPWQKVDRIWIIDVKKHNKPRLMHKRTMQNEIAGHEWWGTNGKYVYFDLQKPMGEKFYIGKVRVRTGKETVFELQRNDWSVHFTTSSNERILAGDGGPNNSVAAAPDGKWIYKYEYKGKQLQSTRLVNMKNNNYQQSPDIHFSPDQHWVIFRANFEGVENIYAVEL